MAKALGATVIGTAGSQEKIDLALAHGYDHVINYNSENFVSRVKELTGGKGVDVAYDSVGRDTFPATLDCIKPRGLWVSFGNASGPVENFGIGILAQKGSLFATRPTLYTHVATRPRWRHVQILSLILCAATKCVSISTRPIRWRTPAVRKRIWNQEKRVEQPC